MIKYLLFILVAIFASKVTSAQKIYHIKNYGAIANDKNDDSDALIKILKDIGDNKYKDVIIQFENGEYIFKKNASLIGVESNISILGKNTTINVYGNYWMILRYAFSEVKIHSLKSGSRIIPAPKLKKERDSVYVHIQSNEAFEKGWGYKANELIQAKIENRAIILADTLVFNYKIKNAPKVFVYKQQYFKLDGFNFVMHDSLRSSYAVSITGAKTMITDVSIKSNEKKNYKFHNGLFLTACYNSALKNLVFENIQYGITTSYCNNINVDNIKAIDVRHPVAPTTATKNVYIKNVYGLRCNSVLDAHVAFNVNYENVYDSLASEMPNSRSFGTTVKNARVIMSPGARTQTYTYFTIQNLISDYSRLTDQYDVTFDNVVFISNNPSRMNGFGVYNAKNLYVLNSKVHSVSHWGSRIEKIVIKNSEIGMYYGGFKVEMDNVIFDGKYIDRFDYLIRMNGSGSASLNNINIKNSSHKYLFDSFHNDNRNNSIVIKNSSLDELKGFAKTYINKNVEYKNLKIENTQVKKIKEQLGRELKNNTAELKQKF